MIITVINAFATLIEILLKNGETLPVSKKHRKAVGDAYLWAMR